MSKIRLLLVAASVVLRRVVADLVGDLPGFEPAVTASNLRLAQARLAQGVPDVLVLDGSLPESREWQALLRRTHPRMALVWLRRELGEPSPALGADEPLLLPMPGAGGTENVEEIRVRMLQRLQRYFSIAALPTESPPPAASGTVAGQTMPKVTVRPTIVIIGASTGGPSALGHLLAALPAPFPVPVVIVQHMPPLFTGYLAERLRQRTNHRVMEAASGEELQPGQVWLAPGNAHLVLRRVGDAVTLQTNLDPPENSCRPSVDVLFRSAAELYGSNALAVVLTGMGQDGLQGCSRVRECGGKVLVQDEATSVVWGMPGHVARAGLAHRALALGVLGPEIVRQVLPVRSMACDG